MLFDDNLIINIKEIFELKYKDDEFLNYPRPFHALSLRTDSEAWLSYGAKKIYPCSDSICYVPAQLEYLRHSVRDNIIVVHMDIPGYSSDTIETFSPDNITPYVNIFVDMLKEWNEKKSGYKYRAQSLLYLIMEKLQQEKTNIVPDSVRGALEYMNSHYNNPDLNVACLAKMSYMSDVYFRSIFTKTMGITPRKYLVNLRISHAVSLLESGYFSVKETAYRSGFTDVKYFSSCFKNHTGISPSACKHL